MEKFKACEKEMKTKAFSKEGLTQHAKLDPKAQEKLEVTQWIQIQVEERVHLCARLDGLNIGVGEVCP